MENQEFPKIQVTEENAVFVNIGNHTVYFENGPAGLIVHYWTAGNQLIECYDLLELAQKEK